MRLTRVRVAAPLALVVGVIAAVVSVRAAPQGTASITQFPYNNVRHICGAPDGPSTNQYPVPCGGGVHVTFAADGYAYNSLGFDNAIGRTKEDGSTHQELRLPDPVLPNGSTGISQHPHGMAIGSDGNVWFTQIHHGNGVSKLVLSSLPAGSNNDVQLGAPGTTASNGTLWDQYKLPCPPQPPAAANPNNIMVACLKHLYGMTETPDPDGNLWFAEAGWGETTPQGSGQLPGDTVGKVTPSGVLTEYPVHPRNPSWVPCAPNVDCAYPFSPMSITVGPDGNIWFTETIPPGTNSSLPAGTSAIGKMNRSGVLLAEYAIPFKGSGADGITSAPDDQIYFTDAGADKIGRISVNGDFTGAFHVPTQNNDPSQITVGSDGNLWFTEGGKCAPVTGTGGFQGVHGCAVTRDAKVARLTLSTGGITEFDVPTSTGSPDGFGLSGLDRGHIWFMEPGSWAGYGPQPPLGLESQQAPVYVRTAVDRLDIP